MRILPLLALLIGVSLLAGCDALGIESGTATTARKEADGKAIGSACRHAMRAIEDCYTLNPKASKAAVYAGWLDMDGYMRENKIDGIAPVVPRKSTNPPSAAASDAEGADGGGTTEGKSPGHAAGGEPPIEAVPRKAGKSAHIAKAAAGHDPTPREATTH